MGLNVDLEPGDMIVVQPDSGAQIRVKDKSGRKTSVVIESAKPVRILKARDAQQPQSIEVARPRVGGAPLPGRPRA